MAGDPSYKARSSSPTRWDLSNNSMRWTSDGPGEDSGLAVFVLLATLFSETHFWNPELHCNVRIPHKRASAFIWSHLNREMRKIL